VLSFLTVGELEKWTEVRAWGARSRGALDRWISRRPMIDSDQTCPASGAASPAAAQLQADARTAGRGRAQQDPT